MQIDEAIATIESYGPCPEAIVWLRTQPDFETAWANCQRGDWMLWLLGRLCRTIEDRKILVRTACACARLSLQYVPPDEQRPRIAIETAEAWANRMAGVTIGDVRNAAHAAHAAYAAYVAYVADAASVAAVYASYASVAAAYAYDAASAASYAASQHVLAQCAEIVRKHYATPGLKEREA